MSLVLCKFVLIKKGFRGRRRGFWVIVVFLLFLPSFLLIGWRFGNVVCSGRAFKKLVEMIQYVVLLDNTFPIKTYVMLFKTFLDLLHPSSASDHFDMHLRSSFKLMLITCSP